MLLMRNSDLRFERMRAETHTHIMRVRACHTHSSILPADPRFKAKFRRRTSHKPNRMQMRKILCSPSLAIDSAHHCTASEIVEKCFD